MHSAGEYWRYTQLCEPFDLSVNEFMGRMTAMFGMGQEGYWPKGQLDV